MNRFKRTFVFFSIMIIAMLTMAMSAFAEETNVSSLGSGTEEDPYIIDSYEDLCLFRDSFNAKETVQKPYVELRADINLDGSADNQWIPIGSKDNKFGGVFNGNSHTISNLYCDLGPSTQRSGLIAEADGIAVKNLNVHNVYCTGLASVSAIMGSASNSTIDNCHVSGEIYLQGYQYIGGIVGKATNVNTTNCSIVGNEQVRAQILPYEEDTYTKMYAGGIIGWLNGAYGEKISNCIVKNLDIKHDLNVGSITGLCSYDLIESCVVENVTITADSVNGAGGTRPNTVGLLAGGCYGSESDPSVFTGNTIINVVVTDNGEKVTRLYGEDPAPNAETGPKEVFATTTETVIYVAKIGESYYLTIDEALEALTNGDTLILLDDVAISSTITIAKNNEITFDLNGKVLKATESNTSVICVSYGAHFILNDSVGTGVIDAQKCSTGFLLTQKDGNQEDGTAKLTINAGKVLAGLYGYGIAGNGGRHGTEIIINGGTIETEEGIAIFHPQSGTITVNGGIIKGAVGIEMRGGELYVTGGEIYGSGELYTNVTTTGATVWYGVAIALSQHSTNMPTSVVVKGGTLSAEYAFYQNRLTGDGVSSQNISATISSNANIDGLVYAAENGFIMAKQADGSYALKESQYQVADFFEYLGYSYCEYKNGITTGYKLNTEIYEGFVSENVDSDIDFGVVFGIESLKNGEVRVSLSNKKITSYYNAIIVDIDETNFDTKLIMAMYVTVDGVSQYTTGSEAGETICTLDKGKVLAVSYNTAMGKEEE
ncbi:MAG: hypothetical protein IJW54_06165 [Clostridia bacterium]|nr:hypothetical protein [Clostridia bacterium]